MKLSREKINRIASLIAKHLESNKNINLLENINTIRMEIAKIITQILEWEMKIDKQVKDKIAKQKKSIHEGTPEWNVLYRNYYQEELSNYGKYNK
jgi:hypothetical protein